MVSDPPSGASLSWKLITPAIASDPYCAAAPSRSTSIDFSAIDGITAASAACDPVPPTLTLPDLCRRRPLSRSSVLSAGRQRKLGERLTLFDSRWTGRVTEKEQT